MRRFDDSEGRQWEVVVGRESWGAIFAIFVPVSEGPPVRQTLLQASSFEAAHAELNGMPEAEVRALLARSHVKNLE